MAHTRPPPQRMGQKIMATATAPSAGVSYKKLDLGPAKAVPPVESPSPPSGNEVETIRAAVNQVSAVAALPQVTARIISLVENPLSSAAQLQKVVEHDPALVTRLLKVVNSSFYGLPGEIDSVDRAIVLLGLQAVKNIAVAASLGQLFRGSDLGGGRSPKDLWAHCVGVAVAARELSKLTGRGKPDESFLCGMVHDLGVLLELQLWPEKLRTVCDEAARGERPMTHIEREAFGSDHTLLGAGLAAKWKFPKSCRDVCRHHHRPELADAESADVASVVYAADVLACEVLEGFNLTALRQHLKPQDSKRVYIDADATNAVRDRLPEMMEEVSRLLEAA